MRYRISREVEMRRGRDETRSRSMKRTQQKLAITNNKKKKKNEAEDSLHVQENWFLTGPTRGIPRGRELKPSYPFG